MLNFLELRYVNTSPQVVKKKKKFDHIFTTLITMKLFDLFKTNANNKLM